jgi:hypothetical protein
MSLFQGTITLGFYLHHERLMVRLQEVPKGDKWSRRHLSSLGNTCLHLRDISAPRECKKM